MSVPVPVVDDEPDVEALFKRTLGSWVMPAKCH